MPENKLDQNTLTLLKAQEGLVAGRHFVETVSTAVFGTRTPPESELTHILKGIVTGEKAVQEGILDSLNPGSPNRIAPKLVNALKDLLENNSCACVGAGHCPKCRAWALINLFNMFMEKNS